MGRSISTLVNELRCFRQKERNFREVATGAQSELKARHPWRASLKGVRGMTKASMSRGVSIRGVLWASTLVASVPGCDPELCDVVVER